MRSVKTVIRTWWQARTAGDKLMALFIFLTGIATALTYLSYPPSDPPIGRGVTAVIVFGLLTLCAIGWKMPEEWEFRKMFED